MSRTGPKPKAIKFCKECGFDRPREDFVYGGLVRHLCRDHYSEYHRQEMRRQNRKPKTPEKAEADKAYRRKQQKRLSEQSRRTVLEHYSGTPPRCACCGETNYEFLALDHINGGGEQHRRETTNGVGGRRTYDWAIRNGFPPIFRVLCHNCNASFGYYGYCPHQQQSQHEVDAKVVFDIDAQ